MILKFRFGQTDWKLIEGFKEIHYFNAKEAIGNKEGELSTIKYLPWGREATSDIDYFNPSTVYHLNLVTPSPARIDIGIIGSMKHPDVADMFLLLGCDEVFILNDEGKTIDRIN